MRSINITGIAAGLLAVAVLVASVSCGTVLGQGPTLGRPGAVHGGFGAPGAMQPSMGRRMQPRMSYGRGRSPATNAPSEVERQGSGRVNYIGAEGRRDAVMDRAGPRSSQQFRQEAKRAQGPLTNFSF